MSERLKLLVVDDEAHIRRVLQAAFDKAGYTTLAAEDAHRALSMLEADTIACVLTDVTMPGMNGYEFLRQVRAQWPEIPIVIMTAYGTIPAAVQAIRDGAFEYVTKPFDLETLKKIIATAVTFGADVPTPKKAARNAGKAAKSPCLVAESAVMRDLVATLEIVADSKATVLVTGESGVGKEVVAKTIHEFSGRSHRPFVAVSCAALPESLLESELFGYEKGAFTGANGSKVGRFEMAHSGTLFLDEIGEIPLAIQVKLLRVLQEREFERLGATKPSRVDVRLITATNRDLREAVDQGIFRLDLMYRLQVVELHIPPLRERPEDILPLATLFLRKFCEENGRPPMTVGPAALEILRRYPWPGNVRELENTMERATVLTPRSEGELLAKFLPVPMQHAA